MNLNELRPADGSKRDRKRVGRGHGTGWGKTAGKGHNGQKQRSGTYVSPIFEGGQMPIIRRVPKRGFSNSPFKKDMIVITLSDIVEKFNDGDVVSLETLGRGKRGSSATRLTLGRASDVSAQIPFGSRSRRSGPRRS